MIPADTGADIGTDIFRIASEVFGHFFYCCSCDISDGPTPAGVGKAYSLFNGICEEERYAVCKTCHKADARSICHQRIDIVKVAFSCDTHSAVFFGYMKDVDGMRLLCIDHIFCRDVSQGYTDPFEILENIIGIITSAGSEVQAFEYTFGHATESGRESVGHKGKLIIFKWGKRNKGRQITASLYDLGCSRTIRKIFYLRDYDFRQ